MKIEIIPFNDKYLNDIRAINVSVSSNPDKPYKEKVLTAPYIDYYTEFSKENCFIAKTWKIMILLVISLLKLILIGFKIIC